LYKIINVMKKSISILLVILSVNVFGQKINCSYNAKASQITKDPIKICTGYDKEFDETVKFAFETYWKHSPLEFISLQKLKNDPSSTNFYISGYTTGKKSWRFCNINVPYVTYKPIFDNFIVGKDSIGLDYNYHMKSIKVIAYIMCFSSEINRVKEMGGYPYSKYTGLKEKLKDSKVIIQKENIETGRFTETPFKAALKNCEFMDSETLYNNMKDRKIKENTSLLCISREDSNIFLSIIDINNGDLLYYNVFGLSSLNTGKALDDSVIEKLLQDASK